MPSVMMCEAFVALSRLPQNSDEGRFFFFFFIREMLVQHHLTESLRSCPHTVHDEAPLGEHVTAESEHETSQKLELGGLGRSAAGLFTKQSASGLHI